MRDTQFSSKAYGTHEYKDLTIDGRVQFDVYMALQRDHKLSSYSLNAVGWAVAVARGVYYIRAGYRGAGSGWSGLIEGRL